MLLPGLMKSHSDGGGVALGKPPSASKSLPILAVLSLPAVPLQR